MKAYPVEVRLSQQEDGLWRAEIPKMPGSFVDAPTVWEALRDIQEVAAMFIDLRREEQQRLRESVELSHERNLEAVLPVVLEEYHFGLPHKKSRLKSI